MAAIALVVAVVVVVALVAFGGSDSPKGGRAAPGAGLASTPAGVVVITIVGKVNTLLPNGDFVVNDGHADYTVAMSSAEIVDLNGSVVTAKLIQPDGSVQITGALEGSTITAQTVIVPSSQEPAPTTT